jgi:hypothetical protein
MFATKDTYQLNYAIILPTNVVYKHLALATIIIIVIIVITPILVSINAIKCVNMFKDNVTNLAMTIQLVP